MKLYRIEYWHTDRGQIVKWASAKSNAESILREMKRNFGESQGPSGVTLVDVPTDKRGLIYFLNCNAGGGDGS